MTKKLAGQDYKVCGMEGLWWGPHGEADFLTEPRETWCWKLIVRVPDFVTTADVKHALEQARAKRKANSEEAAEVRLEKINEGLVLQALHVGPYTTEMNTIARMRAFAREKGYCFHGLHHELYLSDPRRVPAERLKTLLRLPVRRAASSPVVKP